MDIDLDIDNYTLQELFSLIGIEESLDSIDTTKHDIIHSRTNSIISKVRNTYEIDPNEKIDIIEFFHDVKHHIIDFMKEEEEKKTVKGELTKSLNEDTISTSRYSPNISTTNNNNVVVDNELFTNKLIDKMLEKTELLNLIPYVQSQSGIVNPIKKQIVTKVLNIDTLFRERYRDTTSTDFTHYIRPSLKNIVSMRLNTIELPNIWHMFKKEHHNNVIEITVNNFHNPNEVGSKQPTINQLYTRKYRLHIPNGNYTTNEFLFTMNKILWSHDEDSRIDENNCPGILNDAAYSGLRFLKFDLNTLTGETIITTIPIEETSFLGTNPISHRVNADTKPQVEGVNYVDSFQNFSNGIISPQGIYASEYLHESFSYTIDFDPDGRNRDKTEPFMNTGWFLGFRKNKYHVDMNNIEKTDFTTNRTPREHVYNRPATLVSEGIFGSNFNYYLYMIIDDYQQNKYESVLTNSEFIHDSNILARITIKTNFNTIIFNSGEDQVYRKREYFGPVTLDKLNIKFIDKFGRTVDIRNNNFSFALEFEQEY